MLNADAELMVVGRDGRAIHVRDQAPVSEMNGALAQG